MLNDIILCGVSLVLGCGITPLVNAEEKAVLEPKQIQEMTRRVADWQLTNPSEAHLGDWVQGPYLNGLLAIGQIPGNERYVKKVFIGG